MNGFYGNITDTSNQIFQFDRIFPNRKAMDDAASSGEDGIFTGHFVLVKYNNSGDYLLLDGTNNEYSTNYDIDRTEYGNNFDIRGYDATVWQKIYSNGKSKFISVATLNGLMPTIDLVPDAPTQLPSKVYLDQKTPGYGEYIVKVPTQWGFRIKEASNNLLSDQQVIQSKIIYNENSEEYEQISEMVNADIYFHKNGGNKMYKSSLPADIPNEIILTPTGKSGKLYDGVQKEDCYELGIHLPMIGNMVSDGYDLIYGYTNNQDNNGNLLRPTDITYYSGDASNELKQNGNSLLGGKTYNLNTIAGSLNTIHNILGQIIVELDHWPLTETEIADLPSQNYIYVYNSNYYRKDSEEVLIAVQDNLDNFSYIQQYNVPAEDYETNKYYKIDLTTDSHYGPANEGYNEDLAVDGYYLKNINGTRFTPIDLVQFSTGNFYYKVGENYFCDNSAEIPMFLNQTYYTNIQTNSKHFEDGQEYFNNGSFYTLDNGNYIPSYSVSPSLSETYYHFDKEQIGNDDLKYYYHKNSYYYKNGNEFILDTADSRDPLRDYYILKFKTVPKYGLGANGQIIQYYELDSSEQVYVYDNAPVKNNYIFYNNNYIAYDNIGDLGVIDGQDPYTIPSWKYYQLANIAGYLGDSLYIPGVYYLSNNSHDYIKSYESLNATETYYLITNVDTVPYPFYIQNTYYYYDENLNNYELATSTQMIQNETYYTKAALFVAHDNLNQCPIGYEWSNYSPYIPPSITLGVKEYKPTLIKISNLDINEHGLLGLLLSLHKSYADNNILIRDINTLRGAINSVKDLLYQVKTLQPGHLLYVNNFGQITSSPITYDQLKNIIN